MISRISAIMIEGIKLASLFIAIPLIIDVIFLITSRAIYMPSPKIVIKVEAQLNKTKKSASYSDLIGFPQNLHDIQTIYCLILSEKKFFAREIFYREL